MFYTRPLNLAVDDRKNPGIIRSSYLPTPTSFVRASRAFTTKQFFQVWLSLFINTSAGVALLGVAKNVLTDVFSAPLQTWDSSFPATYVALLSLSNAVGRIAFARLSDRIGRKVTFGLFFIFGVSAYSLFPVLFQASPQTSLNLVLCPLNTSPRQCVQYLSHNEEGSLESYSKH